LNSAAGTATDGLGNLDIADSGNNIIRKLACVDYVDQAMFTVTNVDISTSSNKYSVILAGPSGGFTSSMAMVNLRLPPIMASLSSSSGICTFTWSAMSNLTYQLPSAKNLAAPERIDLLWPITATNQSVSVTDAIGSGEQRFYRVRLWP
jgi:hypothetical protein